ncbi:hypothetical protein QQZ08_006604 [Neonectria magnoliae]|uniref:Anticodon-binding domain-containing protein n=1 Tax=Neonectria magnoliae TaxID=2732573 RepID=A0ABR1I1P2_9HYPO
MKDLYTFDLTTSAAIETYREVSAAYRSFFSELKLPFIVAEASSGDMGGDLSHEYHLPSAVGEDTVVTCGSCEYAANDEVATARSPPPSNAVAPTSQIRVWRGISQDRNVLINAWYPQADNGQSDLAPNLHAVKSAVPELDTSIDNTVAFWEDALSRGKAKVINVIDTRLASSFDSLREKLPLLPDNLKSHNAEHSFLGDAETNESLNLVRLADGDGCPKCEEGTLKIHRALEVGHTFHLGTRYSASLDACVMLPQTELPGAAGEGLVPGTRHPVQMGCHGVGVSRIFGAVAEVLADKRGLNWPRSIAPFEVALIPTSGVIEQSLDLYDTLVGRNDFGPGFDIVLDDRKLSFGWKMKDADMIGYPVVVIMGKLWKEGRICEVQCRRLSVDEKVSVEELPAFVSSLLEKL